MECFDRLNIVTSVLIFLSASLTVFGNNVMPWCYNNSHITGSWVKNTYHTITKKSFVCCGGTFHPDESIPLDLEHVPGYCNPENTVSTGFERGYLELGSQCGDDCCRCDREDDTRLVPNKREAYHWDPLSCHLQEWNATLFCELLGSRTMLLMGDSTMQETAATLMSMVSANKGLCATQIFFSRSDFVGFKSRNQHSFQEVVDQYQPSIAIITAGAHLKDTGDLTDISSRIHTYLKSRMALNLSVPTMVWKTQNPAHVECKHNLDPLQVDIRNITAFDKYDYKTLRMLDEFMKSYIIDTHKYYSVLDMYPLYLRADAHILGSRSDCMHYCLPGPLNIFSVILLQMLFNKEI
mmetsp:Transcript_20086/g.19382  ORF Transcript_20086/g.19382 Transcript_20086/m.19382 type:complete len:351 (+) Transcript_20086:255-1307(+)